MRKITSASLPQESHVVEYLERHYGSIIPEDTRKSLASAMWNTLHGDITGMNFRLIWETRIGANHNGFDIYRQIAIQFFADNYESHEWEDSYGNKFGSKEYDERIEREYKERLEKYQAAFIV
jgi:hypothetical protein